ncbi:glycosyltransferase [Tranquillimonas alkanivorans]|uniref:Glycosyltransferase involved in cell wall bisynthesis n=1 Tax=Tranquillimonas alkanivorans TaxID=441119 RepID=A0A1I5M305_9RHOB|nr:glycosyltransferase [Tranquillimonas alkanivorans]SFP03853.1 Glycosyltransferase involved in cell wall bisynthesis [Tranquillimonas alkanivorans]
MVLENEGPAAPDDRVRQVQANEHEADVARVRPLKGFVTYGPRQSLTSFRTSRDALADLGTEIDLVSFRSSGFMAKITEPLRHARIVGQLRNKPYDFAILNSGASLIAEPRLVVRLVEECRHRQIPTFVLWRNARVKLERLRRRMGARRFDRSAAALRDAALRHLAISERAAEDVAEFLGVSRAEVIYNCQRLPAEHLTLREPEDPPLILNVATASRRKRPDLFVEVAARVCRRHASARFVWLGSAAPSTVQRQIDAHGLGERCTFLPFDPDPFRYMAACSVFLLTSEQEGFGLVVAEAMACGRTPIVFAGTGAEEVASSTGRAVAHGDVDAMADAVLEVIDVPPDARINPAARQRYLDTFAPKAYAARLDGLIRRTLDGASDPRRVEGAPSKL